MKRKLSYSECCKHDTIKSSNIAKLQKEQRIIEYNKNPKRCLYCNAPISYERKSAKFCNNSCAAKYNNSRRIVTDKSKRKTSETLKNKPLREVRCIKCGSITYTNSTNNNILCDACKDPTDPRRQNKICQYCGKPYINNSHSHSKYCSIECRKIAASKKLKAIAEERIKSGKHKGWTTRNIESYPEKFFKQVLNNNNILYKFNYYISKKKLGLNEQSGYFLDFFIEPNIDLEIDGKQHKYFERKESDKIRDGLLKKNGFIVYRIEWNEINSENGKQLMKTKIDKFLQWYNNELNLNN